MGEPVEDAQELILVRIVLPSAYPHRQEMISMAGAIAAQGP